MRPLDPILYHIIGEVMRQTLLSINPFWLAEQQDLAASSDLLLLDALDHLDVPWHAFYNPCPFIRMFLNKMPYHKLITIAYRSLFSYGYMILKIVSHV